MQYDRFLVVESYANTPLTPNNIYEMGENETEVVEHVKWRRNHCDHSDILGKREYKAIKVNSKGEPL